MKYLITESQLDSMVFKYLDSRDFIVKGNDTSLFFINSEDDDLAQIRYDENDGICLINIDLNREVSSMFSLGRDTTQGIIGKWVEHTLQMKVTKTSDAYSNIDKWLRIPN